MTLSATYPFCLEFLSNSLNLTENRHHASMPSDEGRFLYQFRNQNLSRRRLEKCEIVTSTHIVERSHVTYVRLRVCGKKLISN